MSHGVSCHRCQLEYPKGSVHTAAACANELALEALDHAEELYGSLSAIVGADPEDLEIASQIVSTLRDIREVLGGSR